MKTVAVFTTKGGTGKSALTVLLAEFLATGFEQRVLVVDLDPQQSSAVALLGDERLSRLGGLCRAWFASGSKAACPARRPSVTSWNVRARMARERPPISKPST